MENGCDLIGIWILSEVDGGLGGYVVVECGIEGGSQVELDEIMVRFDS